MAEHVERMGRRIRERREELGLTQTELAQRLPGSQDGPTVSRWERGRHRPSDDHQEQLAEALETTVAYLHSSDPGEPRETPDLIETWNMSDSERLKEVERIVKEILERLTESDESVLPGPLPGVSDDPSSPEAPAEAETGERESGQARG